jgi:type II secretory ATPase GspE/PulE/Tfp pilus assembly ATPase PilB-like protein
MLSIDKRDAIKEIPIKKNIGDIVLYVAEIFRKAIEFDASDIHVEPQEHFLLIRFRQDGDFHLIDRV